MKTKLLAALLAGILCAGILSGCGAVEKEVDKSAPVDAGDITEGLFILTAQGEFYQPNADGQNFTNEVTNSDARRLVVSHETEKFIPTLYADDLLVYFSTGEIPDRFGIERFRDVGYTIGLSGLSYGSSGDYTFTSDGLLSQSAFRTTMATSVGSSDTITIITVDGEPLLQEAVSEAGTILNLEKDQNVSLGLMKGTYYTDVDTTADVHVWYSTATAEIRSYKTTKNGYIVLAVPENITNGYVSVANTGLIYVSEEMRP